VSVARDVVVENVGSGDPQSFVVAAAANVQGVVVQINHNTSDTDLINGVTYGGVALTRIATISDPSGELGRAYLYFLGSGVPGGSQTCSVDKGSATNCHVIVTTLTAGADIELVDSDTLGGGPNPTNPSIALQYGGRESMGFINGFSGVNAPGSATDNAGQTRLADHDFGSASGLASAQTNPSTSDTTLGYTIAINPGAFVAAAFAEAAVADRQGRLYYAEIEVPDAPRRGVIFFAEIEVPTAPRRGLLFWAEIEVPDPSGDRQGLLFWAEIEVPTAPRRGQLFWAEIEAPNAPRRGRIYWTEVEVPGAPRRGRLYWTEIEVPDRDRRGRLYWAEIQVPDVPGVTVWINWAWLNKHEGIAHEELVRTLNRKLRELERVIAQLHDEADALEARIVVLEGP
jgi:hypothetical protein